MAHLFRPLGGMEVALLVAIAFSLGARLLGTRETLPVTTADQALIYTYGTGSSAISLNKGGVPTPAQWSAMVLAVHDDSEDESKPVHRRNYK